MKTFLVLAAVGIAVYWYYLQLHPIAQLSAADQAKIAAARAAGLIGSGDRGGSPGAGSTRIQWS